MTLEEIRSAHDAMRAAYWDHKDLDEVVRIAQDALAAGQRAEHGQGDAAAMQAALKAIAFDLGSFTWPGWDEPGIAPTPEQMAIGLDAARFDLDLAITLGRPDDKVATAHWLLGAQLLANGDPEAARASFEEAAAFAARAADRGQELLARAFVALVDVLGGGGRGPLDAAVEALRALPDGASFADQVTTAEKVFG